MSFLGHSVTANRRMDRMITQLKNLSSDPSHPKTTHYPSPTSLLKGGKVRGRKERGGMGREGKIRKMEGKGMEEG